MLAFREFVRIALSKQYHLRGGVPLDAAPISLTRAVAKATHASHLPTLWGDLGRWGQLLETAPWRSDRLRLNSPPTSRP